MGMVTMVGPRWGNFYCSSKFAPGSDAEIELIKLLSFQIDANFAKVLYIGLNLSNMIIIMI